MAPLKSFIKTALMSLFITASNAIGGFMTQNETGIVNHGNVVIKLKEDYLQEQKVVVFREFIRELEKFHLTDITIKQKTDYARLTAYMH